MKITEFANIINADEVADKSGAYVKSIKYLPTWSAQDICRTCIDDMQIYVFLIVFRSYKDNGRP